MEKEIPELPPSYISSIFPYLHCRLSFDLLELIGKERASLSSINNGNRLEHKQGDEKGLEQKQTAVMTFDRPLHRQTEGARGGRVGVTGTGQELPVLSLSAALRHLYTGHTLALQAESFSSSHNLNNAAYLNPALGQPT
ncbi:hypothetical protein Q8A73_019818 [Channa argus]|nr:hypothetical protein Q8A73_019818 [Channa argus]